MAIFLNATLTRASTARHKTRLSINRISSTHAAIASMLSQIVDTLLFVTIAFYGEFPIGPLIVGQMIAKVALSAILIPPLIYVFVGLGRKLDRA